ncbi:MAG: hypothetical protein LBJ69_01440 [Holosporales bacterium]|nr:hypothetical protein [Holosporales bacterium]
MKRLIAITVALCGAVYSASTGYGGEPNHQFRPANHPFRPVRDRREWVPPSRWPPGRDQGWRAPPPILVNQIDATGNPMILPGWDTGVVLGGGDAPSTIRLQLIPHAIPQELIVRANDMGRGIPPRELRSAPHAIPQDLIARANDMGRGIPPRGPGGREPRAVDRPPQDGPRAPLSVDSAYYWPDGQGGLNSNVELGVVRSILRTVMQPCMLSTIMAITENPNKIRFLNNPPPGGWPRVSPGAWGNPDDWPHTEFVDVIDILGTLNGDEIQIRVPPHSASSGFAKGTIIKNPRGTTTCRSFQWPGSFPRKTVMEMKISEVRVAKLQRIPETQLPRSYEGRRLQSICSGNQRKVSSMLWQSPGHLIMASSCAQGAIKDGKCEGPLLWCIFMV